MLSPSKPYPYSTQEPIEPFLTLKFFHHIVELPIKNTSKPLITKFFAPNTKQKSLLPYKSCLNVQSKPMSLVLLYQAKIWLLGLMFTSNPSSRSFLVVFSVKPIFFPILFVAAWRSSTLKKKMGIFLFLGNV